MTAIQLLAVLPAPVDSPGHPAEGAWRELEAALRPLGDRGLVTLERLQPPTENALVHRLAQSPVEVLHFIGEIRSRALPQYEALVFESGERRSRTLTAQYLSTLLRGRLRLIVMQPGGAGDDFTGAAQLLLAGGCEAVLATGGLTGRALALFAVKLYAGLAGGYTLEDAVDHARQALEGSGFPGVSQVLLSASPAARLRGEAPGTPPPPPPAAREPSPPGEVAAVELAARRELERKQAEGVFDVFLCHNAADKSEVKAIARQLKQRGVLPWLDEWELPPGQPWQPMLERQIGSIRSAAVFVGAAGVGPWQEMEIDSLLREFVARKCPVIPVVLPDAPATPELPIFLRAMTWVDFRRPHPEPLPRLLWGITGRRPAGDE